MMGRHSTLWNFKPFRAFRCFYHQQRGWVLVGLFILTLTGCKIATVRSGNQFLPTVSPLPLATPPGWIQSITPTEEAKPLNQINVIFSDPLIPLESLDSPQQQDLLKLFEIRPNIPGAFRFLTPRMVGFQADRALPLATRVQVTLKKGLKDLNNHELDRDFAWTFNTAPIQLSNLPGTVTNPGSPPEPMDINPTLKFTSNVALDLKSLEANTRLVSVGSDRDIPLKISRDESRAIANTPQDQFDPSQQTYDYQITPQKQLEKATAYSLEISAGLKPASGNLPSEIPFSSQFKTYSPLNFEELQFYGQPSAGGAYGRFVKGSPELRFNNPIVPESASNQITINPPPPPDAPPLVQFTYEPNLIHLNPYALEPDTQYTITIGADLEDKFGQKLGNPITLQYETGNVSADMWTPSGLNIFPNTKNWQLDISTVNLPDGEYQAAFRVLKPTDLVYTQSAYPQGDGNDLLPAENQWPSYRVSGQKNQVVITSVNLPEKLGGSSGVLAYGVRAKTNSYVENGEIKWNYPSYYGLVELTNLGVFAQWFPESGLVRVNRLESGKPVEGATVEVYLSKLDEKLRPEPKACAMGKTDDLGLLQLTAADLRSCMGGTVFAEPPQLLVIAREGSDWAFTRTESYSGAYGYGVDAGWSNQERRSRSDSAGVSRGTIFSDRQLYQPGEKVALTGVAYYLQQGQLQKDARASYHVILQDPKGAVRVLGDYITNDFGTFSLEFSLDNSQMVGEYQVLAHSNRSQSVRAATGQEYRQGGLEIQGSFQVAEFKPPNFKGEVSVNKALAQPGDVLMVTTRGNYLFGAPVVGGKVEYYITRAQTEFTPSGWEGFRFGRQWFWPEEAPKLKSDVWQTVAVLDGDGSNQETFKIDTDLLYPMIYRVDASVSDVSNLSVTDSQSVTVLPSDRLIGLKSNFVAEAGQAFSVEVIVTDWEGQAKAGERVKLELQKMTYSRVTRVVEGGRSDRYQVEYETVSETTLKSGQTPITAELTPPDSGSYRIRAELVGSKSEATATDLGVWATGGGGVQWGYADENKLEIKLDRETYKVGDTATALIQSPYTQGQLYFAVVRDKPLFQAIQVVQGGAPQVQFQITPEMLPNAAFEAVLVRQGESLETAATENLVNLVKIGFVPFKIDLSDRRLSVNITPSRTQLAPGEAETLQLQLRDSNNQPLPGQLTVMVVNEAILQLSGYRPPNLMEIVYAEQPIATRFSDNRPNVSLQAQASPLAKGWGYGGGFSAGTPDTRTRTDFQPLAYYNGSVVTNRQGQATVNFILPDDLTTWRVMVVATDGNFRFGEGETTLITTKPILTNPILPQFVRPGDRPNAGLSITNTTENTGTLKITGTLSGGLTFDTTGNTQDTRHVQGIKGTIGERFPMTATRPGIATVAFATDFKGQAIDAFEIPLEIKPLDVTEQVVESGITATTVSFPINLAEDVYPHTGGLEIHLASTLIPQIMAPAQQVFSQTPLPFAEPMASQLLIAASLKQLSAQYGQAVEMLNLPEKTNAALTQLASLQQEDGGFSRYPSSTLSDPYLTPYVAEALARANQAGLSGPSIQINRLQSYLQNLLANPENEDFCTQETLCKSKLRLDALIALAEWGQVRNDFLADIYSWREQYDPVTQIRLARYLSQFPEWRSETQTLVREIWESISQTGRTAPINLPPSYQWWSSATRVQAEALRLAIAQKSPLEDTGRLLTSLLNLRRQGTWGSTYDNAQALSALVTYAQTESIPPNFAVEVTLGGQSLGKIQFQGYQKSTGNWSIPMSQLPKGNQTLVINKSGPGNLHYLVSYRYRLTGSQPGRLNGLRVVREVRPANSEQVLWKTGLYALEKPLEVKAGQVFDVGLEIISDRPVDHVVITDPLPAGLEAINGEFQTNNLALQAQEDSWEIGYQQVYKDRIVAYGDRLTPGVYALHYLARSVTPGTYLWPGAEAHLQYAPEEFGRNASSQLMISQ